MDGFLYYSQIFIGDFYLPPKAYHRMANTITPIINEHPFPPPEFPPLPDGSFI